MTTILPKILVTDFDGTLTRFDFYDLVCREFPEISVGKYWSQYEAGEITHFEALRCIFAALRCSEQALLAIVERMELDPQLPESVKSLQALGWEIVVASAGCRWYIDHHLQRVGLNLMVHANPGVFSPTEGLLMSLPQDKPFFSGELGVNKLAVVKAALQRAEQVAFAGDGRPDLAPALAVPGKWRFARGWLAKKLLELDEEFQPFERWSDIAVSIRDRHHAA